LLLGPRETSIYSRAYLERERFPEALALESLRRLQLLAREDQTGPPPIIDTGSDSLRRVHKTRIDLNCDANEEELNILLRQIAADEHISDVVLFSGKDIVRSLYRVGKLVEQLEEISHVTVVRLRSWAFNHEPQAFSDTVIKRIASWNKLSVAAPTRLEIETQFLHPSEFNPAHEKIAKALRQRGVTVYNNTPLLAFINDSEDEVFGLTSNCRRAGIEVTHLYIAGMPLQQKWNEEHPIHVSQVIDISSHLRRSGGGRELPRYIVRTPLGDADLGLTALVVGCDDDGTALLKLLPYDLEYFTSIDPGFTWPEGVNVDDDGHPIVAVRGLLM
jgi:lysine 2,3-aminomutase